MPFAQHGSRAFTTVSIANNAPAASGVYGLSNAREWIYVGATADIQSELLKLLRHPDPFLKENAPSGFTYELRPVEQMIGRQNELVLELDPVGNRLVEEISDGSYRGQGA